MPQPVENFTQTQISHNNNFLLNPFIWTYSQKPNLLKKE